MVNKSLAAQLQTMPTEQRTTGCFWSCSSQSNGEVRGRSQGGGWGKQETRYDITSPALSNDVMHQNNKKAQVLCLPAQSLTSPTIIRGGEPGHHYITAATGSCLGNVRPPAQPPPFNVF